MLTLSTIRRRRRRNVQQSAIAANLPAEILLSIFANFIEKAPDYIETEYAGAKLSKSDLPAVALVCVRWSQLANMLLYQHGRVTDLKAMSCFLRTLKSSREIQLGIQSFTYRIPACLENETSKRKTKLEKELLMGICDNLRFASLDLKLTQSCTERLLQNTSSSASSNITSLHILASAMSSQFWDVLPSYVTLPKLESLTLEFLVLDEAMSWPEMPALRCLRLVSCALFEVVDIKSHFEQMHSLTRLELHHVHYQADSFPQLLRLCASTLEELVVLDVNGPMLAQTMDDLRFCPTLKKLCVGPFVFPVVFQTQNLSEKFPPTLEELTIFEIDQPMFSWFPSEIILNCIGLKDMLKSCDGDIRLKRVHVRGREEQWNGREEEFAKECQRLGIQFSLETFKACAGPTIASHTWRQRTWRSVRNSVRRARHLVGSMF